MPDLRPPTISDILEVAKHAESAGLDRVYVSDHLFLDIEKYGGPAGRYQTHEAFGLLHALAAGTSDLELGTLVLCSPFRNPAVLSEQVRTLQEASDGRFVCGLGAGWYEPEFKEAGLEFGTPGSRIAAMRETAALLKEANHARTFIGGKGGPKILEAVAQDADGWNVCWRSTPDFVAERGAALAKACVEAGRDPLEIEISVGLYTLLATDDGDLQSRYKNLQQWTPGGAIDEVSLDKWAEAGLVASLDDAVSIVKSFEASGANEIILSAGSLPFSLYAHDQIDMAGELKRKVVS